MVKIPTYDDVKTVPMSDQGATGFSGGQINVASDTGLQSFGRGVQNMATNLKNIEVNKQKKSAELWVGESNEKLYREFNEWEKQFQIDDDSADGKGSTTQYLDKFQELSDKYLKESPNQYATQAWKKTMNNFKLEVFKSGAQYEAARLLLYQTESLNDIKDGKTYKVAENPLAWDVVVQSYTQIIEGLEDSPETKGIEGYANIWSDVKRKAELEDGLNYIAKTAIESILDEGDATKIKLLKKMFDDEKFKKYMDPDEYLGYKNKVEQWEKGVTKLEKAKFETKMTDSITVAQETGTPKHELKEADFISIYGKSDGEAAWYKYNKDLTLVKKSWAAASTITSGNMSKTDIREYVKNLPRDSADNIAISNHVKKVEAAMEKEMEENPVGFIQKYHKSLFEKLASDDSATVQAAISEFIQFQKNYGVKDIDILGNGHRQEIVRIMMDPNANAESIGVIVAGMKTKYGDHWDTVMANLISKADLNGSVAASLMYYNEPEFNEIFNVAKLKIDTSGMDTVVGDVKKDVTAAFEPVANALVGGNRKNVEMVDGWRSLIEKAVIMRLKADSTLNTSDTVEKVMETFINSKYFVMEEFIVPKQFTSYDGESIEMVAEKYIEDIKNTDLVVLLSGNEMRDKIFNNTEGGESFLAKMQKENISVNTRWRNKADGTGIELVWNFDSGTFPVLEKVPLTDFDEEGSAEQQIEISWEELDVIIPKLKTEIDNKKNENLKKHPAWRPYKKLITDM
jgi:hypothetical protein